MDLRNAPDLPADFSRRVSIVAEGQVSGLRDKGERRRFVALLALASAGAAVFAAAQSEALVRASGSFSVKVFGLIPIAVSFVQNLSLGCFGVLRTVCNRILGDASSTLPMLFTLFVAAVLAFLVIASARRGPGGDEL